MCQARKGNNSKHVSSRAAQQNTPHAPKAHYTSGSGSTPPADSVTRTSRPKSLAQALNRNNRKIWKKEWYHNHPNISCKASKGGGLTNAMLMMRGVKAIAAMMGGMPGLPQSRPPGAFGHILVITACLYFCGRMSWAEWSSCSLLEHDAQNREEVWGALASSELLLATRFAAALASWSHLSTCSSGHF